MYPSNSSSHFHQPIQSASVMPISAGHKMNTSRNLIASMSSSPANLNKLLAAFATPIPAAPTVACGTTVALVSVPMAGGGVAGAVVGAAATFCGGETDELGGTGPPAGITGAILTSDPALAALLVALNAAALLYGGPPGFWGAPPLVIVKRAV